MCFHMHFEAYILYTHTCAYIYLMHNQVWTYVFFNFFLKKLYVLMFHVCACMHLGMCVCMCAHAHVSLCMCVEAIVVKLANCSLQQADVNLIYSIFFLLFSSQTSPREETACSFCVQQVYQVIFHV